MKTQGIVMIAFELYTIYSGLFYRSQGYVETYFIDCLWIIYNF